MFAPTTWTIFNNIQTFCLRYLAEIIPPADTAVEAFETVVGGEDDEEAEVKRTALLLSLFLFLLLSDVIADVMRRMTWEVPC